jgi:hypothetical protein
LPLTSLNGITGTWSPALDNTTTTLYTFTPTAGQCATTATLTITVNPAPTPSVTGPAPVCESVNNSTATYSTAATGNTFNWVISAGGTIVSGQGTNSITVQWTTPGPKTVQVTETTLVSVCSASNTLNVLVTAKPATTPITHN